VIEWKEIPKSHYLLDGEEEESHIHNNRRRNRRLSSVNKIKTIFRASS
jgi:hypothetical protein